MFAKYVAGSLRMTSFPAFHQLTVIICAAFVCIHGFVDATTPVTSQNGTILTSEVTMVTIPSVEKPTTAPSDNITTIQSAAINTEDSTDVMYITTWEETTDVFTELPLERKTGGQATTISTEDSTDIMHITTGEETTDVFTTLSLETATGGQSTTINTEDSTDIMHITTGEETTDVLTTLSLERKTGGQSTTINTEDSTDIMHITTGEETTDVLTTLSLERKTGGQSTTISTEDGTADNGMTTINPITDTVISAGQATSKVDSQSDFTTYEYLSFLTDDVTVTEKYDATAYMTSPAEMPETTTESTESVEVTSIYTEMASPPFVENSTTIHDKSMEDLVTLVTELETQTMDGSVTTDTSNEEPPSGPIYTQTSQLTDDNDGEGATEVKYTENYITEVYETITVSDVTGTTNGTSQGEIGSTDKVQPDMNNTTPKVTTNNAVITPTPLQFNATTATLPDLTENYVQFQLYLDMSVNITDETFVNNLETGLAKVISLTTDNSVNVRKKRFSRFERMLRHTVMRRATSGDVTVQIHNLTRNDVDPRIVDTYFTVEVNGTILPSTEAASKFENMSISRLSASLGYEVISVPTPVNLPGSTEPTSVELDTPTGDLQDFLMMIILVPLNVDITEPAFQTDISNGIEAIYLAGMASSNRKRRDNRVLLDGRIIEDDTDSRPDGARRVDSRETEFTVLREGQSTVKTFLDGRFMQNPQGKKHRLRHKRQLIEDPSHEYAVNLKSVNRPKSTDMDVTVVFAVLLNGEVVDGKEALSRLDKLSLHFITTVLGYKVKEPGIALFDDSSSIDRTLWIIIVADVAVIIVLAFILTVYCLCKKNKQTEVHKQAVMSKMDRSTSIEMGFVRIGVQSSDQMAIQEAASTILEKSGAHAMHGTVRDKLTRKRQRKQGIYNKQTNMNIDSSSSDEEATYQQDIVRPSQLFSASNRIHPSDTAALVLHSDNNGEYSKEEYVPKFKKREDDENMRRQQQLQAQLNREMATRLGAVKSEKSGFQQQIDDLIEGASNLNITDRGRKSSKAKRKFKRENVYHQNDITESVEASQKPRITEMNKTMNAQVVDQRAPMKAIHRKTMKIPTKNNNSSNKSNQVFEFNKDTEEIHREELYRELRRRWKKERKRISKFLDESFQMTTSLLDNNHQSRVTYLKPSRELPPIRETPLTTGPYAPYPYLYHHSIGPAYHRPLPLCPNAIEEENNHPGRGKDHGNAPTKAEEVQKQGQDSFQIEKQMNHKIKWTNSMKTFQPKEKLRERPARPLSDEKKYRRKKRR